MSWPHRHPMVLLLFTSLWFAAGGFSLFRFPTFFVGKYITFGIKWPSSVRLIRTIGMVYMGFAVFMAATSLILWP